MSEKEQQFERIYKETENFGRTQFVREIQMQINDNKKKEREIERLNNIIKEVREYIASFNLLKNLGALEKEPISISELKHILELLNIGEDDEEN